MLSGLEVLVETTSNQNIFTVIVNNKAGPFKIYTDFIKEPEYHCASDCYVSCYFSECTASLN